MGYAKDAAKLQVCTHLLAHEPSHIHTHLLAHEPSHTYTYPDTHTHTLTHIHTPVMPHAQVSENNWKMIDNALNPKP